MPNIVGYTDCAYIKGQYYRYAASPKPVVYTGNIDTISEDLLVKTMLVTRGNVSGTLPNDAANTFLVTTVKYGTDVYLQTAYIVQEGFNCYEYKRIYSGGWTDWVSVDEEIATANANIVGVAQTINGINSSVNGISQSVSSLNLKVNNVESNMSGLSSSVSSLSSNVRTIEQTVNKPRFTALLNNETWKSGSKSYPNAGYSALVILARVHTGGSLNTCIIPIKAIDGNRYQFCISDDEYYITFLAELQNNTINLYWGTGRSGGYIQYIYGMI